MLENDFADSRVTVKKSELLATIRANRETHVADYSEARDGYRLAIQRGAADLVRAASSASDPIDLALVTKHPVPTSHEKDYTRVIRMLEMSTAETVTISESQFSQYVLDEWTWQAVFAQTKARYSQG